MWIYRTPDNSSECKHVVSLIRITPALPTAEYNTYLLWHTNTMETRASRNHTRANVSFLTDTRGTSYARGGRTRRHYDTKITAGPAGTRANPGKYYLCRAVCFARVHRYLAYLRENYRVGRMHPHIPSRRADLHFRARARNLALRQFLRRHAYATVPLSA